MLCCVLRHGVFETWYLTAAYLKLPAPYYAGPGQGRRQGAGGQRQGSKAGVTLLPVWLQKSTATFVPSTDTEFSAYRTPSVPWTKLLYIASPSCHAPSLLATVL